MCGCWEHSPNLSEPPLQPWLYFVLRLFFPAPEKKEVVGTEGNTVASWAITGHALSFSFAPHPSLFPQKKFSSNTQIWTVGGDTPGRHEIWKNTDYQRWHLSWRWPPSWHNCWPSTWVSGTKWPVCSCVCTILINAPVWWGVLLTFKL